MKADRTLTLFMINTIADNARKFTPEGGKVMVSAEVLENCVEVSIADTGKGMDEEQLAHVFDRTYTGGHGFGLLNCKGIIEKYKKVSSIFSVCQITCESEVGKGSVFRFRLPKGMSRVLAAMVFFMGATSLLPTCSVPMTSPIVLTSAISPVPMHEPWLSPIPPSTISIAIILAFTLVANA